ncbi:hypothetical protein GQ607_001259 [Colletotrichum asianum]|uniref:Uncharacterized protein n=1 Tax=Colletotrichum asianum TaxID=702518 RepID=A0A8H3WNX6_9PEZI|nr:hypothetical protein GQ607_001259 [Colletotrichum asianum]
MRAGQAALNQTYSAPPAVPFGCSTHWTVSGPPRLRVPQVSGIPKRGWIPGPTPNHVSDPKQWLPSLRTPSISQPKA